MQPTSPSPSRAHLRDPSFTWLALLACLALVCGCGAERKNTLLHVRVRGEHVAASDIVYTKQTTTAVDDARKPHGESDVRTWTGKDAKLPFSFGVAPAKDVELDALIAIEVGLRDGTRLTGKAVASFVKGQTRLVDIVVVRDCEKMTCTAEKTCGACGACVALEHPTMRVDASEVSLDEPLECGTADGDAGMDGGADARVEDGSMRDGEADPSHDPDGGLVTEPELPDCKSTSRACIKEVRVSLSHACAVTYGGALYCWGSENPCGALGEPTFDGYASSLVQLKLADHGIVHVGTGTHFTCALTDGRAWGLSEPSVVCWGKNTAGQLATEDPPMQGDCGRIPDSSANAALPKGSFVVKDLPPELVQLRGYDNQAYVLTSAGRAWYWGDDVGPRPMPFEPQSRWLTLDDGHDVSIERADGRWVLHRWTKEIYADEMLRDAANLEAWGACVVTKAGRIDCQSTARLRELEIKTQGELGRKLVRIGDDGYPVYATPETERAPIDMAGGAGVGNEGFTQVSGAGGQICALRGKGELWCWGLNQMDQFGLGKLVEAPVWQPERVGDGEDWVDIEVGGNRTCGIKADRSMWCAGMHHPEGGFTELEFPAEK